MSDIVTRAQRAKSYAAEYLDRFKRTPYWKDGWPHLSPPKPPASRTYARLADLGPDPDPDMIDEIMDCKATFATCDECGNHSATVAEFDINCGEFKTELCADCCEALATAIRATDKRMRPGL